MGNLVPNAMSGLDMETGSFTPVLYDRTTAKAESYTANNAEGYYCKIGKLVWFTIEIGGIANLASQEGTNRYAGVGMLPYRNAAIGVVSVTIGSVYHMFTNISDNDVKAVIWNGAQYVQFTTNNGGDSAKFSPGYNAGLSISGIYITDDVTPAGGVIFVVLPDIFSERRWAA